VTLIDAVTNTSDYVVDWQLGAIPAIVDLTDDGGVDLCETDGGGHQVCDATGSSGPGSPPR
jgi:hypothetical protein